MTIDWTKALERIVPLKDGEDYVRFRTGVVDAINADGTLDVIISGLVVQNIPRLRGAHVVVGDTVNMGVYLGAMIVLGATAGSDIAGSGVDTQVFTATDTWDKLTGASKVWVRLVGGGGGGGGCVGAGAGAGAGGGGGAGGFVEHWFDASDLGATETVTIGAGGAGSAGSGAGGTGGDTTFDILTGGGATGGSGDTATTGNTSGAGGPGGAATGGDINAPGQSGYYGVCFAGPLQTLNSKGASSQFGAGGQASGSTSVNGNPGTGYGAGGGGAIAATTTRSGGDGTDGICIVVTFF